MHITLAYGKDGLPLELDDALDVTVVEPAFVPALPDPRAAVRAALEAPLGSPPLRELVRPGMRVGVVFSDITRPAPNPLLLAAVLEVLDAVPGVEVTLFNALGTHRPNTEAELRTMLGDAIFESRRIVQNNTFEPATQVRVGVTSKGHETWLNAELMRCELKVLTGFIEPHLFAGFSGGGKAIMPGMAGQRTVLGNHDAGMVGHPKAIWGVTHGNPIWEEVREVAGQAGRLFLLNVTLNRDKAVTGVFAGDLDRAHAAGCAFVKRSAMVARPPAVRHRRHDELRLPARHQPLPVGQGHAGRRSDRPSAAAPSSSPRAAGTASRSTGSTARSCASPATRTSCSRGSAPPDSSSRTSGRPISRP